MNDKLAKFRELLDSNYQWPDYYEFKFIIKISHQHLISSELVGFDLKTQLSKNGNYVSVSARKLMTSTQEVLDIYLSMSKIEGVISL